MNITLFTLLAIGALLGLGWTFLNKKGTSATGRDPLGKASLIPKGVAAPVNLEKIVSKARNNRKVAYSRYMPVPEKFMGRKAEFAEIKRALQSGTQLIGLYGIPGIGKTTLACHVGLAELPRYTDGQFYIDLKAGRAKALSPLEVMARIIQFFNPDEKLPSNKARIPVRYRSVLKNKRAILVFDNLDDPVKARNLLPPKSCLLITTSEKNLSLPGMFSKGLDVMELDDARDLFQEMAPRSGFWSKEIAKLCGGVPLALTLGAKFIAHHSQKDPSLYTQDFHNERTRMAQKSDSGLKETIIIAFNITLKNLSDAALAVLSRLLVFPDSFTKGAEAFICEDNDSEQLGTLVMLGLVNHNDITDRYSMHREVKHLAERQANNAGRVGAQARLSTYYLNVIVSGGQSFSKGGESGWDGLGEFDLEWENIRVGFEWARENCSQDKDAIRLCSAYTEAGADMLAIRQPVDEYIRWLETAVKTANLMMDPETEKNHIANLGKTYNRQKQYDRAIEYLERARSLAKELDDKACEKEATEELGRACLATNNSQKAIPCFQRELILLRASEDRSAEMEVLQNLGWAYHQEKQLKEAAKFYDEGLELARKKNDKIGQGIMLGKLGHIYTELDDPNTAVKYLEQSLTLTKATGDKPEETNCLKLLGDAQMKIGDHRKASLYYKQGLAAAQETGNNKDEGVLQKNLGDAFSILKENQVAMTHYQHAAAILKKTGPADMEGETLWNLSRLLGQAGNKNQAVESAQTALRIFEDMRHPETGKVRKQLEEWNKEIAASGQKTEE